MSKGDRREREAREIYENAGYEVQPFYGRAYGETDGFGLFDFVALKGGFAPTFGQVKSNQVRYINEWFGEATSKVRARHANLHYLVAVDRKGWRLAESISGGYEWSVDERDEDCKMGEGLTEYLKG